MVLLEHQYTEANFSLRNLKGHDRSRAAALFAAAPRAGLAAHLALATLHQMGQLEDDDDFEYGRSRRGRGRGGYDDPSDGSMGEIYEESLALDHWRDERDRKLTLGSFPADLNDAITGEDFSNADPDEKEGEGFTGNAGCTMEYWYRRAAIVLWPQGHDEEIQCAANLPAACESLLKLASRKNTAEGSPFDKLARAAIRALAASEHNHTHSYGGLDRDGRMPLSRILGANGDVRRMNLSHHTSA